MVIVESGRWLVGSLKVWHGDVSSERKTLCRGIKAAMAESSVESKRGRRFLTVPC